MASGCDTKKPIDQTHTNPESTTTNEGLVNSGVANAEREVSVTSCSANCGSGSGMNMQNPGARQKSELQSSPSLGCGSFGPQSQSPQNSAARTTNFENGTGTNMTIDQILEYVQNNYLTNEEMSRFDSILRPAGLMLTPLENDTGIGCRAGVGEAQQSQDPDQNPRRPKSFSVDLSSVPAVCNNDHQHNLSSACSIHDCVGSSSINHEPSPTITMEPEAQQSQDPNQKPRRPKSFSVDPSTLPTFYSHDHRNLVSGTCSVNDCSGGCLSSHSMVGHNSLQPTIKNEPQEPQSPDLNVKPRRPNSFSCDPASLPLFYPHHHEANISATCSVQDCASGCGGGSPNMMNEPSFTQGNDPEAQQSQDPNEAPRLPKNFGVDPASLPPFCPHYHLNQESTHDAIGTCGQNRPRKEFQGYPSSCPNPAHIQHKRVSNIEDFSVGFQTLLEPLIQSFVEQFFIGMTGILNTGMGADCGCGIDSNGVHQSNAAVGIKSVRSRVAGSAVTATAYQEYSEKQQQQRTQVVITTNATQTEGNQMRCERCCSNADQAKSGSESNDNSDATSTTSGSGSGPGTPAIPNNPNKAKTDSSKNGRSGSGSGTSSDSNLSSGGSSDSDGCQCADDQPCVCQSCPRKERMERAKKQ